MKTLEESIIRMKNLITLIENVEPQQEKFNLQKLSSLPSFNQRIQYCQQNLQRVSSGTSRIVYVYDEGHVLKLAKNPKGLEQNLTEADGYIQDAFTDIVANVTNYDQNDRWILVERAQKVRISDFPQLLGVDFKTVEKFAQWMQNEIRPNRWLTSMSDEEARELVNKVPFFGELHDMVRSMDMSPGDFGRLSSYGIVNRNGKKVLVLIDYGITQTTLATMYREEEELL